MELNTSKGEDIPENSVAPITTVITMATSGTGPERVPIGSLTSYTGLSSKIEPRRASIDPISECRCIMTPIQGADQCYSKTEYSMQALTANS